MTTHLSWNRYGKSSIRLVKVRRPSRQGNHELIDLTVDVQLEGAFDPVYVDGDNGPCIATDTMKNTVYALARQDPIDHVETFAVRLANHFMAKPAVAQVRITTAEHRWERLGASPHAFIQPGREEWTAVVTRNADGTSVTAGLTDLVVLKTADSAFAGFPRDEYTTLPDTNDRILATSVTAAWTYRCGASNFSAREPIRGALLDAFARHGSRSVQHTLYAMAEAALEAGKDVTSITLSMPNRHHLLVDLKPFGLDNPSEIFVATDQPFGLIEATITRALDQRPTTNDQ